MAHTEIWVSLGKKRYVGGTVTEVTGKDISTATITLALASSKRTPPSVWEAPDVDTQGATTSDRVVKLLVTDDFITEDTPLGTYYCWANVEDDPEIEPFVISGPHELK